MIHLGYEVGTGKRVSIPLNHMVVLGQTQLSGKTTTLEALVARSGIRAIAFITKPGEKSFRLMTPIPAYFSEATLEEYWKHVVAILEYRGETHLGWRERGVVIKLCQDYKKESSRMGFSEKGVSKRERVKYSWKPPKTLQALLANIEAYLPFARSSEEMICIQLREYLRPAITEIEQTEFSDKLELARGINVMDITGLSDGLKSLVIRSVIEQVHKRMRNTVVIVPEAWKFIPEGRSTPVKLALEGLIREGAGIGNFVWMDSQDLRGVDKKLLRSVIVWLFGVQRQRNEVSNTLDSIPDHPKPTATEIMQLGKGQFYVCYGSTLVRTYVQPAGMEDEHAKAVSLGDEKPESWSNIVRGLDYETSNAARGVGEDAPGADQSGRQAGHGLLRGSGDQEFTERNTDVSRVVGVEEDEKMWKEKYEALKIEFDQVKADYDALSERMVRIEKSSSTEPVAGRQGQSEKRAAGAGDPQALVPAAEFQNGDLEAVYRYIVARAAKEDPKTLRALFERPELLVEIRRQTIEANGGTLRGALAILISEKYFDGVREFGDVRKELIRRGFLGSKAPNLQISQAIGGLVELGFLTKEETGYQCVVGMKVRIQESAA